MATERTSLDELADTVDNTCELIDRLRARIRELEKLRAAVLYAFKEGCFHPVPQPPAGSETQAYVRWGAMRHLHAVIAGTEAALSKGRQA